MRGKAEGRIGLLVMAAVLLFSCSIKPKTFDAGREDLFSMKVGEGEEDIVLQDFDKAGQIHAFHTMADGFFYIACQGKLFEMNSYGAIMYLCKSPQTDGEQTNEAAGQASGGVRRALKYPIIDVNAIAVDTQKRVYVATAMPEDERENDGEAVRAWVVLRISQDGSEDDYIGSQGAGGHPFPYIKNVCIAADDELVVVCEGEDAVQTWYFSQEGKSTGYMSVPRILDIGGQKGMVRDVIAGKEPRSLLVCADSYAGQDAAEGGQYLRTFIVKMDVPSGELKKSIEIPPYERIVSEDFGKVSYKMPYDFLGVSDDGNMFFVVATDDGFAMQIVSSDGKHITKRNLKAGRKDSVYNTMSVSKSGIVSAMMVQADGEARGGGVSPAARGGEADGISYKASFMWWRTDKEGGQ